MTFDLEDWTKRILALNPWAAGFTLDPHDNALRAARSVAMGKRHQAGKEIWNRWAEAMLALKEEAGRHESFIHDETRGLQPWEKIYLTLGDCDYRKLSFSAGARFEGFVFPALVDFAGVQFGTANDSSTDANFKDARFAGGTADFRNAVFHQKADFSGASFSGFAYFVSTHFQKSTRFYRTRFIGEAFFTNAQFHGDCEFDRAVFQAPMAGFSRATFQKDASFSDTDFSGGALFNSAEFHGETTSFASARFNGIDTPARIAASFGSAKFSGRYVEFLGTKFLGGDANFAHASFEHFVRFENLYNRLDGPGPGSQYATFGGPANFSHVKFGNGVTFEGAEFRDDASFRASQTRGSFLTRGATFATTPDFIGASFEEPPRLDDVRIGNPMKRRRLDEQDPRGIVWRLFKLAANQNEYAKFRTLRRIASNTKDQESELRFGGYEIASRRFWIDRPLKNGGRFWLGWIYGWLSNYGQSIAQPALGWAATVTIFAILFLTLSLQDLRRAEPPHPAPFVQSLGLEALNGCRSGSNRGPGAASRLAEGFMLSLRNALIFDRADISKRMYGCLYGTRAMASHDEPIVPVAVTLLSSLESVISGLFLFLIGVGLRNMFRVK